MSQLSERYATALYEVTQAKGNTNEILDTLLALRTSLEENKDVLQVLTTPLISETEKEGLLKTAVASALTDELTTFFKLLVKNNRLGELSQIVLAFKERVARELGVESGVVRSATELNDTEKKEIQKLIEKKLSKKVELTYVIDSKMIGGVEAKVGSYIFEDSIKTHMQKLNDFITRRVQ
jgi:F-type H+-transporting ATPase subunit delta